ncbi:cytokine receptor common subunit beta [Mustelus asterias]
MAAKERVGFLCLFSVLTLSAVHCAAEVHDVASSLQCYTDYISEIDCKWTESLEARKYIPMDLYYRKKTGLTNNFQLQRCNSRRSPKNSSKSDLDWKCTIMDNNHAISYQYHYIFKPERPVNLSKSFRLLENIKPQPPSNLNVAVTEEGDYSLSWQTVYSRNSSNPLFGKLQYDINYKRSWEPWESSVTESIQNDKPSFLFSKSCLAASDTYIARVRTKPQSQGASRGHWSDWSSELQWNTAPNAYKPPAAEDEVMPRNLQCTYDGIQEIECTWEVTKESSKYFKFHLHYRETNHSETKECEKAQILRNYSHLIIHVCHIRVDTEKGLNDYQMFLIPAEPMQTFEPYKHIKPKAPFNLTTERLPDENYQLKWEIVKALHNSEYEIRYKKLEDSWENAKEKKIPHDTKFWLISKHILDSSSRYTFRVRTKVKFQNEPFSYRGPWSEWSEVAQLETKPDKKPFIIASVVILMCLIVAVRPCFCLIRRKKRSWLNSIPDPAKSKLFLKQSQKGQLGSWAPVEIGTLEEGSICQVVTNEWLNSSPQLIPKEEANVTQKEKERGIFSALSTGSPVDQEQLYREIGTALPAGQVHPNRLTMLSEPADYDGPYLFNYQDVPEFSPEGKNGFNTSESYFKFGQGSPPGYVKLPESSESPQANSEQVPALPVSMYVVNPLLPVFGSPSAAGYHTGNTTGTCFGPEQPTAPTSSYVLCPPSTNPATTPPPGANAGYVRAKETDVTDGFSQPAPGPEVAANPAVPPQSPVSRAETLAEGERYPQSCPGVSLETPTIQPWQPAGSGSYVLTVPGGLAGCPSGLPEQDASGKGEEESLWAEQRWDVVSEPSIWPGSTQDPKSPHLSKLPADPQIPATKEEALALANRQNVGPNVILYQQGAKPLLLKQIGDYCFIPGPSPINTNAFAKHHPPSSLAKTDSANNQSLCQGLKVMPPFLSPDIPSSNVSLS